MWKHKVLLVGYILGVDIYLGSVYIYLDHDLARKASLTYSSIIFFPNSTTNSKSASLLPTVCITPFQVDSFNFLNAFNFPRSYVVDSVAFRYYICNMKTCLRFSTNFVDVLSLWNFQLKSCRRAVNTSVPLLLHKSVIQCYVRASFTIIVSASSVACFSTIPSINNFIEHRSLIAACCFSWLSFSCDVVCSN